MKLYRSINAIINYKTLIVTGLSVFLTYMCQKYNMTADLPITLLGTAIVFPVVFSISSAYKRREDALTSYSTFRANCYSLVYASKNWVDGGNEEYSVKMAGLLCDLQATLAHVFTQSPGDVKFEDEVKFYKTADEVSKLINSLKEVGVTAGELTRMDNYLNRILVEFDKMKNVLIYRTPTSIRAYAHLFIYTFPIIYSPYFAYFVHDGQWWLGIEMAVLCSFIFVSLANIQDHLENPFDQIGEDDIRINVAEFKHGLVEMVNSKKKYIEQD